MLLEQKFALKVMCDGGVVNQRRDVGVATGSGVGSEMGSSVESRVAQDGRRWNDEHKRDRHQENAKVDVLEHADGSECTGERT